MNEYYNQFLQWSINNPVVFAVATIIVQLLLAVMLGETLSRFLIQKDVKLVHRLWCAMAVLALLTIPIHLLWHTAGIPIASKPLPQESSEENRSAEQADENMKLEESDSLSEGLTSSFPELVEQSEEIESTLADPENADQAIMPTSIARVEMLKPQKHQVISTAWIWLAAIYAMGVVWCLGRVVYSYLTLTFNSTRKLAADSMFLSEAAAIAHQLELKRMPVVKLSNAITNPFVYGWIKPVLVVPEGIERWSSHERLAVLAHELAHVGRNDFAWTFLSKIAVALYWFHPAVWWMDRQLAKSRELATDDCAVNHGLDRNAYAKGLVQVLERLSACKESLTPSSSLAISMSSFDDLCDRVKGVLDGAQGARPAVRWLMRCLVIMVFACVALTSMKFRVAEAQSEVNKSTFEAKDAAAVDDARDEAGDKESTELEFVTAKLDKDDNDLLALLLRAEPTPQDTRPNAKRYSFEGVVQDQDGNPVANATVVLDEQVYVNLLGSGAKLQEGLDVNPKGRLQSILAKTTTDEDGRFEFRSVALTKHHFDNNRSVQASLIAVHPEYGVQFQTIHTQSLRDATRRTLKLSPLTEISLTYATAESKPIANAVVVLGSLNYLNVGSINSSIGLIASQVQPIAMTDTQGKAVFKNVPEGCLAYCSVKRGEWGESSVTMKTSSVDDTKIGRFPNQPLPSTSPARVIAQKDFVLFGKVTNLEGQPVGAASVYFESIVLSRTTNEDGSYHIPISRDRIQQIRDQKSAAIPVGASGGSPYLRQTLTVNREDLKDDSFELNFQLQRGIHVSGRIIDNEGKPANGVDLFSIPDVGNADIQATTKADGTFVLHLDPRLKFLYLASRDGRYQLPSSSQLFRSSYPNPARNDSSIQPLKLPKLFQRVEIDISDGKPLELQPITVQRQQPIEVVVSQPNGDPAAGATVVLLDYEFQRANAPAIPSIESDVSNVSETNSIGRVVLKPYGMLTDRATAKIEYRSSSGEPFTARVPVKANGELVSVILKRNGIVVGRVLVNDKPIAGAVVSVQDLQPVLDPNGNRTSGFTSRPLTLATTNAEGEYSASVPDDKSYMVVLSSVPGITTQNFSLNAMSTNRENGIHRVKDMNLKTHPESASGFVVDHEGNPIEGASIQVDRYGQTSQSWIGFKDQSQLVTDREGRFSLKNIPAGTHEISVDIHKNGTWTNAMQKIQAGDQNIRIVLNYRPTPPMKRLEPKSVTPIQR